MGRELTNDAQIAHGTTPGLIFPAQKKFHFSSPFPGFISLPGHGPVVCNTLLRQNQHNIKTSQVIFNAATESP